MKCTEAKSMFSPYLDGAVTGQRCSSQPALGPLCGLPAGICLASPDPATAEQRCVAEKLPRSVTEIAPGDFAGSGESKSSATSTISAFEWRMRCRDSWFRRLLVWLQQW